MGKSGLPFSVGDVFAVPFPNGKWGAIRVLRVIERSGLVAVTPYLGDGPPEPNDADLRRILRCHRGRYGGDRALTWYSGRWPREFFEKVTNIAPSGDESSIECNMGGGHWNRNVAQDVWLERGLDEADYRYRRGDRTSVRGQIPESEFWRIIELTKRDRESVISIKAAVRALAGQPVETIAGFEDMLARKLFALDGQAFAGNVDVTRCVDSFLYARCAVVARGKNYYADVLSSPRNVMDVGDGEMILSITSEALESAGIDDVALYESVSYETFSNEDAW